MITPAHGAALRAYKYSGQDRSILYHYLLSPWAQYLVDVATPPWLAPNAITFLGLLPPILTLCTALYAQPGLGRGIEGWVALLCAASMFIYSTLDNMDGKQARKTGSSSALGLLFDHGCDAINAGLLNWANIALIAGVQAGSFQTLYWFLIPVIPFFFATWEERHMGVFILPLVNGPNEGIYLCISLMVLQFFQGQEYVWHTLWAPAATSGAAGVLMRAALWCAAPLMDLGQALQGLAQPGTGTAAAAAHLQCSDSPAGLQYLASWLGALPWVWGGISSSSSSSGGCTIGSTHTGDIVLCLVLIGALATAVYNTARVCEHVWSRGSCSSSGGAGAGAVAQALLEVLVFAAILLGLAVWLFHPALHALVAQHWALVFAAAGCLFVELSVRHMLAHVCHDNGLLSSGTLTLRIAAFAALPMVGLRSSSSVASYGRPALVLVLAATALPALHLILTACAECSSALGIHVFSIQRQLAAAAAAAAAEEKKGAVGARGGAGAMAAAGASVKKRRASTTGK